MSDLEIVSLHILLFCNYYILFKNCSFVVVGGVHLWLNYLCHRFRTSWIPSSLQIGQLEVVDGRISIFNSSDMSNE